MKILKKSMIVVFISIFTIAMVIFLFQLQKPFGSIPKGKRLERIEKSKNYKNGSFENLSKTSMMREDISYFKLMGMYLWNKNETNPKDSLPSVIDNYKERLTEKPVITWFGHSSYLIQFNNYNILVDPVFSKRASPVSYAGSQGYSGTGIFNLDLLPALDVVIITHDHYDHLDYETMLHLKSTSVKFYTPLGVGAHLEYWGIAEGRIHEMDWWEEENMGKGIKIIAAPARHFSGRKLIGGNKSLWASFIIKSASHSFYIGGDSGYDTHFKEIGDQYGPFDLVALECGQYNSYWPYIHMMPEETAVAAKDLKARALLPVHWSKFTLALHPWDEPIIRVVKKAQELDLKITTPMIGEKIIIDSLYPHQEWWNGL